MSKDPKKFIPGYAPSGQAGESDSSAEIRPFKLNQLETRDPEIRKRFNFETDEAENYYPENVRKARDGVKELMRDAINKAVVKANELKDLAKKEGYEKGYTEGFEEGKAKAREEFSPVLESLQKNIEELGRFRKMMYTKLEREMIEMTLALVKKIIHFELSTREDSVREMMRLAVQNVLDKESMTIKIHPEDKGYAESFRPELQHMYGEIKNITFEAHPGIQRGGCLIESNFGTVDARIEQLDGQIENILHLAPPPPEKETTENSGEE